MRLKTTTALAVALALPPAAHAASQATDSTAPARETLRAPLRGQLKTGPTMRAEVRERIRDRRERRAARRRSIASPVLEAIAACESGGDPTTDTGNGFYGKYQFTLETWAAVGGSGNPAEAPEAEQDRRAAMLYAQAGSSPWPVCGG